MANIISAVFENHADAERAVRDLRRNGVPEDGITAISHHRGEEGVTDHHAHGHGAGGGALSGLGVGATVGALFGLASIFIPGVGPLIVAGGLASALGMVGGTAATGALVGGTAGTIAGALTNWGVHEHEARHYAGAIERGDTYVGVDLRRTDLVPGDVLQILQSHHGRIEAPLGVNAEDTTPGEWVSTAANTPVVPPPGVHTMPQGEARVPLMEETANVRRVQQPAGEVNLTKRAEYETQHVSEPVTHTRVSAQQRDLPENEKYVPDEHIAAIRPGETLRVPVVEEELIVQRVPRVTKEVVVTAQPQVERVEQDVTLRRERVDVHRVGDVDVDTDAVEDAPARPSR